MDGNQRSLFGLMSSGQLVVIFLLTAAVAASAYSSVSNSPKQLESHAESTNCEVEKVLLLVVEESGRRIPGVQVKLLNSAGARLLGETDNLGGICVARSEFDASVEEYLLFCREGYFCGVFSVQKDVARFEERTIALARVVLR